MLVSVEPGIPLHSDCIIGSAYRELQVTAQLLQQEHRTRQWLRMELVVVA